MYGVEGVFRIDSYHCPCHEELKYDPGYMNRNFYTSFQATSQLTRMELIANGFFSFFTKETFGDLDGWVVPRDWPCFNGVCSLTKCTAILVI